MTEAAVGPPGHRAARPDAIRAHNLGLVLTEVHRAGARTRAELTRRTGLTRSTIGALVTDLADLGLVTERRPRTHRRAGRPSHVVEPSVDGPYAFAADLEIDTLVVAAVGLGGQVLARRDLALPPSGRTPARVASRCAALVDELAAAIGGPSRAVGFGFSVPGTVRRQDGTVVQAPNLDWRNVPMANLLRTKLPSGLQVQLRNDADLGALAEHLRGAGRDSANVLYVHGRIGVGAGVIVDGLPLHGAGGLAGEVGHIVVDPAGPPCHCGNTGCWETRIGEPELLRLAGRDPDEGPAGVAAVMRAGADGDASAAAAMESVSDWLGRGLAALTNVLNPETIVVGGTLAPLVTSHHDVIRASLDRLAMPGAARMAKIAASAFGADSALLGAAELALQPILRNPLLHQPARAVG